MDAWKKKIIILKSLSLASSLVSNVPLITIPKIVLMQKEQVLSANACAMKSSAGKINKELEH